MKKWLLDTGPLVAFFDPRDPAHQISLGKLGNFTGGLVTTSAIITEAMYFLNRYAEGPLLFVDFLETSGTEIVECCQPENLRRAVDLMDKYTDIQMDFADATLVLIADAIGVYDICTLDRRGFRTFRTVAGKRFNLVIDT